MKADAKYHLTQFVHKESLSGRIVYISLLFNDKKMSVFCLVYNFLFEPGARCLVEKTRYPQNLITYLLRKSGLNLGLGFNLP